MTMPTAPTDSSDAIFEYLVAKSRQNLAPVDEVYLTLDDIAAGTGKSKRSVSYALDRLTKQGKVVDRKPRKIRIKGPNGAIKPQSFHGADLDRAKPSWQEFPRHGPLTGQIGWRQSGGRQST